MVEKPGMIFMGSSEFSSIALKKLLDADQNILAVYAQPDKNAGRGMKLRISPVKQLALEHAIPVRQPENFKNSEDIEELAAFNPDFLVVASYGLLLPEKVLAAPAIAPLNIHPSLLPRYRGAAPVQRAIQENWDPDAETGVAIMKLVPELDAGPVYAVARVPIEGATYAELSRTLASEGGRLLLETIPEIMNGLKPVPQDDSKATYARKLAKNDGIIDWRVRAAQVDALIRAMNPWPGARTTFELDDKKVPVLIRSAKLGEDASGAEPGAIRLNKEGISIACGDKWLEIRRIQAEGRKEAGSLDFANGMRFRTIQNSRAL